MMWDAAELGQSFDLMLAIKAFTAQGTSKVTQCSFLFWAALLLNYSPVSKGEVEPAGQPPGGLADVQGACRGAVKQSRRQSSSCGATLSDHGEQTLGSGRVQGKRWGLLSGTSVTPAGLSGAIDGDAAEADARAATLGLSSDWVGDERRDEVGCRLAA
jgi:hypothetical protein